MPHSRQQSSCRRQQEIVALFRNAGLPMQLAEMALSDFEAVQHEHEACLSRLEGRHDDIAMPDPDGEAL